MSSYGLWLSAAGMKVNDHRQTVLTNNMANAHTTGFKHDLAVVMQRRVASKESPGGARYAEPVLDGMSGGADVRPSYHVFAQGPIEHTGRPLDAAIRGNGFFTVGNGTDTRYTRDGRFTLNASGELIMSAGDGKWKVLDDAGAPILVDEAAGAPSVSGDGTIRQNGSPIATLGTVTTDDLQSLRKVGENLFEATEDMRPTTASLEVEATEGSSFDVMQGLASMIETTRAFQLNATMIRIQDELTGQAISRVGRPA